MNYINIPFNCVIQFPDEFLTFNSKSFVTNTTKKMSTTEQIGNWHMQKGALKQKFANLMEDDQLLMEGKKQEKFGKFQFNLSQTRRKLQKILAAL